MIIKYKVIKFILRFGKKIKSFLNVNRWFDGSQIPKN